ncbi:protein AGENET DOMAIN (AGD)-CONTAINING P1 [Beta vulgaris subsp. vulgaris]|uniref:protein AGENET DOMAIN (AGD)-CONTAINING P1 n=1 Tax=Beta vulgaris subsp. vulgaris TaxID=3555 RepID=UPI002036E148|nr:protein AGENET DOMAIN (AGD)-CONTAINING P1 [Beta vulgaris subsp. vulgaris]
MSNFQFKKGIKVEISIDEEGFRGVWFPGTVIKPPSKTDLKVMVEYDTLLAENGSTPLREKVDLVQIRPIPPRESKREYKLDDEVDVFFNDGWWEGVITHVLEGNQYSVYFRPTRDQNDFNGLDLRLHREWVHGKWLPPLEEEAVQPIEEMIHKEKEEKNFSKGSLVEVSSDEDGFEGAWFTATVLEVIGKDKFLIEYRDLKTEDDKEFVREEVDALHIRPHPPKAGKVDKFKQFEEVDALYNDGWWVGCISKVLGDSKYLVYFKSTDEELEFKDDELRLHHEWISGEWVMASKALDLSD